MGSKKNSITDEPSLEQIRINACNYDAKMALKKYQKNNNSAVYLFESLRILNRYNEIVLKGDNNLKLPVCMNTMIDALSKTLGNHVAAAYEKQLIGFFVYILWIFGCSKNQASLSVSEWFNCSESKAKYAFKEFKEDYREDYKEGCFDEIMNFILANELDKIMDIEKSRPFPLFDNSYLGAKRSFENIKKYYSRVEIVKNWLDGKIQKELGIVKYNELVDMIISDYPDIKGKISHAYPVSQSDLD